MASAWKSTHDYLGLDGGQHVVDGMEGIVGGVHEHAAHHVDDRVADAAFGCAFIHAIARQARQQVDGPQYAAGSFMAVGGHRVHVVDQLALVPDVVAGGEHVCAQLEQVFGDLRSDAETAGGVFSVDDDQIDGMGGAHMPDVLADNPAACTAENVADEKNVQETAPSLQLPALVVRRAT